MIVPALVRCTPWQEMDSPSFPGVRTVYRKEILEGCLKEDNTKEVRMASTGKIHQLFVIAHNLEVYYGLLRYVLDSTAHWKISCQHIPTFPISRDFPEISRKVQVENAPTMDPSWESNKRSSCNVKFAEALRRIGLPEGHTWSVEEMGVIRQVMLSPAGIIFVCWVYL